MDTVLALRACRLIGSEPMAAGHEGITTAARNASRAPGDLHSMWGSLRGSVLRLSRDVFHLSQQMIAGVFSAEWRR